MTIHTLLNPFILVAWVVLVLVLFRSIGPRRAAMVAIFGGFLLLPGHCGWKLFGCLSVEKRTIPGLAMALAVLVFDRKALALARPRWVDLPMALFVIVPLVGSLVRGGRDMAGAVDQSWVHSWEWAVPFAVGRLYLGGNDGRCELAVGMVVAGLLYVPLVGYEAIVGPSHYLKGMIYGQQPALHMVERLGGWRGEVLVGSGLELAAWMAVTAVVACWLSACRDRWKPAWLAAPVLVLTTIACRGVFGYLTLAAGLSVGALTLATGRRWFLAALLLVPPSYCIARASGAWDGQVLARAAAATGRASTIAVRLRAEDDFLRAAREQGWIFGAGGHYPEWEADGWWVTTLKGGGIVGLATFYFAFGFPAAWTISRRPPRSVEIGLALAIVLHLIDSLHNTSVLPTTFLGGALLGIPRVARPDDRGDAIGTVRYRIR